jgi:hypothetical protein
MIYGDPDGGARGGQMEGDAMSKRYIEIRAILLVGAVPVVRK